jgi:hypothetical protein
VKVVVPDSSWQRQDGLAFTADLGTIISKAGIPVSQINELFVVRYQSMQGLSPGGTVHFNEGDLFCTSPYSGSFANCSLRFVLYKQEDYSGQTPAPGNLPFHSLEIQVLIQK